MSTQRLRRHQAAEIQESGNPRRSSVRGRRACSARCRTAARQGRPAAGDSTRTPIVAAPCATCLLYLMTTHSGPEVQRPETKARAKRACWGVRGAKPLGLMFVVANVLGKDHEDDVLGDVGRVVADPLEMA